MHCIKLTLSPLVILAACSPQQVVTRTASSSTSRSAITRPAESGAPPPATGNVLYADPARTVWSTVHQWSWYNEYAFVSIAGGPGYDW